MPTARDAVGELALADIAVPATLYARPSASLNYSPRPA
jgi:hypothetical protein